MSQLLRKDGMETFYQIEAYGKWGGQQYRWKTGYLEDHLGMVRPETYSLPNNLRYDASGKVWQTTGHRGTYSEVFARMLLEEARKVTVETKQYHSLRLVRRTLTQDTMVLPDLESLTRVYQ